MTDITGNGVGLGPNVGELKLDLEEVNRLIALADRQRIKGILNIEKGRIEADIAAKEKASSERVSEGGDSASTAAARPKILSTSTIKTYGWDQSEKFVKIYITLNGVNTIPAANVSVEYGDSSFKLLVQGLKDCNHQLAMNGLLKPILPKESHFKIKTDSIVIFLKKQEQGSTWSYLTQVEHRLKNKPESTPKVDSSKDSSAGVMDLMKKMYDEGDDEMKRSIAKAWTESRNKQGFEM